MVSGVTVRVCDLGLGSACMEVDSSPASASRPTHDETERVGDSTQADSYFQGMTFPCTEGGPRIVRPRIDTGHTCLWRSHLSSAQIRLALN